MKYLVLPILLLVFSCSSKKKQDAISDNCLVRKGVAEIGTNRIKLIIADVNNCQKKIVTNIHKQVWQVEQDKAIFQEMDETHSLSHEAKDKTLKVMEEVKVLFATHKVMKPDVVATGVFRDVTNADILFSKIQNLLGVYPRLLSALEEAQIGVKSFQANEAILPAEFMLWDIGGNSMQITVRLRGKTRYVLGGPGSQYYKRLATQILKRRSSPNPVKQINIMKIKNEYRKAAQEYLNNVPTLSPEIAVYGIGGLHGKSILNIINTYHETKNSYYTHDELRQLIDDTANLTDGQLGGVYAANQVTNAIVVEDIMDFLQIKKVNVREIDLTNGILVFGIN
jgi:exopolyphosphatase/guanosine-5'-triphosphate,3'-diphosphate pyrophosphatase